MGNLIAGGVYHAQKVAMVVISSNGTLLINV